jgi:hypothetical protein
MPEASVEPATVQHMDHILEHAQELLGPLRSIGMDQPDRQAETRASVRVLAVEVARLGRPDLDAVMSDVLDAPDGHAEQDLQRLVELLR